jgi:hypothetical protein
MQLRKRKQKTEWPAAQRMGNPHSHQGESIKGIWFFKLSVLFAVKQIQSNPSILGDDI